MWTDGACQRNPGAGGWAAVVSWGDGVVEEHSGGLPHTTNNIMEMTAALEGLRSLPSGSRACVVTDSRYLHDGMTSWIAGWKRRDWRTAAGDPVKNKEIWVHSTPPRQITSGFAGTGSRGTRATRSTSEPTRSRSPPRGTPRGPRADQAAEGTWSEPAAPVLIALRLRLD